MRDLSARLFGCLLACVAAVPAAAEGPDVILGEIDGAVSEIAGGEVFAGFGTTSCNAGNVPLKWSALPSNEHPVIGLSLYRLSDGRLVQLAQSWLKHGIFALEQDICNLGCQPTDANNLLGPGCSDPYGATMNRGPKLGSRSQIDPVTGAYDGPKVKADLDKITGGGWERSIQAKLADVTVGTAEYFVEGQYITSDDSLAGNGLNNVSHRKFAVIERDGRIFFAGTGDTVREKPAILAWPDAKTEVIDTAEASVDGRDLLARIIVASKASNIAENKYRYDYAVYNMNSGRGIGSLTVPIGSANIEMPGFSAPAVFDDGWSTESWKVTTADGNLIWSTSLPHQDNPGNPVRWGSMYSFWFESDAEPHEVSASAKKHRDGFGPTDVQFTVVAPKN